MHPRSIFSYVSLAEKVKTHVILESLTPRRDKYEKAKEKAVDSYVRKNKREKGKKGTSRRATFHKWFLNNEIHTTVHFTIHHPVLLQVQPLCFACKSKIILRVLMKAMVFVLIPCCNDTEPSSTKIKTLSSNGWHWRVKQNKTQYASYYW